MQKNKLLAVVLAILLSACGGEESDPPSPTVAPIVTNGPTASTATSHWRADSCLGIGTTIRVAFGADRSCSVRDNCTGGCTWTDFGRGVSFDRPSNCTNLITCPQVRGNCLGTIESLTSVSGDLFRGAVFRIDFADPPRNCEFRRVQGGL